MYDTDALRIAQYAKQSPDCTVMVGLFVQATIRIRFEIVPQILRRVLQGNLGVLTCNARRALADMQDNRGTLYEVIHGPLPDTDKLLYISSLHNFGIAKGSFFLQLCCYGTALRYGCLDSRNLHDFSGTMAALGYTAKSFTRLPVNILSRRTMIERYLSLCAALGGSTYLWNYWCTMLSRDRPEHFPTPERVSLLHTQCILPGMFDTITDMPGFYNPAV